MLLLKNQPTHSCEEVHFSTGVNKIINQKSNIFLRLTIDILVLAGIIAAVWPRIESAPPHVDEGAWIGYGYYYHLLFEERDIKSPDWKSDPGPCDLPVGKYIYGLGLKLQGHPIRDLSIYNNHYGLQWTPPYKLAPFVPADLRHAARRVACLFSSLAIWLIFIMVRRVRSYPAAFAAVFLILINSLADVFGQALADPILIAFMAGCGLTLSLWRRMPHESQRISLKRIWGVALGVGFLVGMGAGVKANVAALGASLVLAAIWILVRKQTPPESRVAVIAAVFAAGLVAVFVFIAINPTLYNHPWNEVMKFLEFRAKIVAEQQAHAGPAIRGPIQKVSMVANRVLINGPYVPFPNSGLFSLAGLVLLIMQRIKYPRGGEILFVIWCSVLYFATTAWIPLDWKRYYLPAALPAMALAGIAIGVPIEAAFHYGGAFLKSHSGKQREQ